jgi:AAA domain
LQIPDKRPYFNKSIEDLETLSKRADQDQQLCRQLVEELNHRSTKRASELLARMEVLARKVAVALPVAPTRKPANPILADANVHASVSVVSKRETDVDVASKPVEQPTTPLAKPAAPQPRNEESKSASIVSSWIALEALSPQTFRQPSDLASGDKRCVAMFDGIGLPWLLNEKSRPNHQLYYQVVLGHIPMAEATKALIRIFGDDEERNGRERDNAAIAAFVVDRHGNLLEENSVGISSFAWALPRALTRDLGSLGQWGTLERSLVDELTKRLRPKAKEEAEAPLDLDTIATAFQWLVDRLSLPQDLIERPSFALRIFHHFKAKKPPEVSLLNSFYLADLIRAKILVQENQAGLALSRFIGVTNTSRSSNLLKDHSALEALASPAKLPAARWPTKGSHPLVMLQQVAINAIRQECQGNAQGIAAVNGPPGTGKTTLLRDIVAACVMDRAQAMASFENPLDAFTTTGLKVAAGPSAFFQLYRLNETLKGHEALVASSNNKAVENISRELPSVDAIGRDFEYFRTIANRISAQLGEDAEPGKSESSWGLIAAVLGNASNLNAFQQSIWMDADDSLRLYLKAAKGDSVIREIKDADGKVIRREVPNIVLAESPPSPEQAKKNWATTRNKFRVLKAEIDRELATLEKARQDCLLIGPHRESLRLAIQFRVEAELEKAKCIASEANVFSKFGAAQLELDAANTEELAKLSERPGWIARVFKTTRYKAWNHQFGPMRARKGLAFSTHASLVSELAIAKKAVDKICGLLDARELAVVQASNVLGRTLAMITTHRLNLGDRIVDESFFLKGHESWNLSTPWASDALHRKREDLFAAALAVQRAFVDVTAQKVYHNIGALMGAMRAGAFHEASKRALLADLWATLLMVVPVISTTFASVEKMLGDIPPQSFGWLLIDEAGQATPQSAVGALMRARNAVVVGDPLQIPPVVSLPDRLIFEVCKYFSVSKDEWAAPVASVQTVADRASRFQATFETDGGERNVGLPLLVHRRCLEPMFGISNRIAYANKMVYAAGTSTEGEIGQVLGPAAWFDVDGDASSSKWCEAEGALVIDLLTRLAQAGVRKPDIYVITPFRIIAHEMRRLLDSNSHIFEQLGIDRSDWLLNRIGTIHTFQGKEAEAVIAVLGAPTAQQHGARRWASEAPNILNVMVSRAKKSIYVVGSRAAWGQVGHASELAKSLPRSSILS